MRVVKVEYAIHKKDGTRVGEGWDYSPKTLAEARRLFRDSYQNEKGRQDFQIVRVAYSIEKP